MIDPDFWDFVLEGGWDLLFPDDPEGSVECHACGRITKGSDRVEWIDKKAEKFKCPNCDELLELH